MEITSFKSLDNSPPAATCPTNFSSPVGVDKANSVQVTLSDVSQKLLNTEQTAGRVTAENPIDIANRVVEEVLAFTPKDSTSGMTPILQDALLDCLNREISAAEKLKQLIELETPILQIKAQFLNEQLVDPNYFAQTNDALRRVGEAKNSLAGLLTGLGRLRNVLLHNLDRPGGIEGTHAAVRAVPQLAQAWAKLQQTAQEGQEHSHQHTAIAAPLYWGHQLSLLSNEGESFTALKAITDAPE